MNHLPIINDHIHVFSAALVRPEITAMIVKYGVVVGIGQLADGMQIIDVEVEDELSAEENPNSVKCRDKSLDVIGIYFVEFITR